MRTATPLKSQYKHHQANNILQKNNTSRSYFGNQEKQQINPHLNQESKNNPFRNPTTITTNPFTKGDPLGIAFTGNNKEWVNSLRDNPFETRGSNNYKEQSIVIKEPEIFQLPLQKPPSKFSKNRTTVNPDNPFSKANQYNNKQENPFAKLKNNKENLDMN